MKVQEVAAGRQDSMQLDNHVMATVPIGAVSGADAVVAYRAENSDALKAGVQGGTAVSDVFRLDTLRTDTLKKSIIVSYSGGDANTGLYRYNEKRAAWQYVGPATGAPVDTLGGLYAFLRMEQTPTVFRDINGHWAESYINGLASLGIIGGIVREDGTYFDPNSRITRAEFIKMIGNAMNAKAQDNTAAELPFADASSIPDWALDSFRAAYANGWFTGKASDTGLLAAPDESITRQDAITILARIQPVNAQSTTVSFADETSIAPYAKDGVLAFASLGVISGGSDGAFHPADSITRAETAKVILNWIDIVLE